ncbi:haloacid dehalogenase-like hydrolase [Celeribacter baekdonensis]|uniref:Haloacid dehalogenase-like hydrolase n=1 Tax=Celeribacter baekdonensis TaxID=875171 RepID=A0A1G7NTL0_9RHOB|nr:HAD family hydrolase [Celeribacter baekdonensis]SDF77301.1 haloacid dehalogenase-like hydrolase [Celeribacter baekdonensis]
MGDFEQKKIALVYDFDGTLSPEPMQHYGVLSELGVEASDFWNDVKEKKSKERAEELLVYMKEMIDLAEERNVSLDKKAFANHGAKIKLFEGVETWFPRINKYIRDRAPDIEVEHYIISAGLKEMIVGCSIAKYFKEIYACEFRYNEQDKPVWPARIISDTSKTQYLFRINKGVLDVNDSINSHMPREERRIPFDDMLYFGDGDTDVPSMAVMMQSEGHSIAVHKPGGCPRKCIALKKAKRIDFFAAADYRDGSELDVLVKATLDVIVDRILLRDRISQLRV